MLQLVREQMVKALWQNYRAKSLQIKMIESHLKCKGIKEIFLDHFAIVDLPGPHTGIPHLSKIFSALNYQVRGKDYLSDKQNDFCWMAEENSENRFPQNVLPQIVAADFRLDELPPEIRKIIVYYAKKASSSPIDQMNYLIKRMNANDNSASIKILNILKKYLSGRDWPLPSAREFYVVKEFNELLAWVLIFGRQPNHFTLSIHLLSEFADLTDFHHFITDEVKLALNHEGGIIKGSKKAGIEQGSTKAYLQTIMLQDGAIEIPIEFVEFVWRYPTETHHLKPLLWKDYFTGFIAQHANHVIESLYVNEA